MPTTASWAAFERNRFVSLVSEASLAVADRTSRAADALLSRPVAQWPRAWAGSVEPRMRSTEAELARPLRAVLGALSGPGAAASLGPAYFGGLQQPLEAPPLAVSNDTWLQVFGRSFHAVRKCAFKLAEVAARAGWKPRWRDGADDTGVPSIADPLRLVYHNFFANSAETIIFKIIMTMATSETSAVRLAKDVAFLDLAADTLLLLRPAIDAGGLGFPRPGKMQPRSPREVASTYGHFINCIQIMFRFSPAAWPRHSNELAAKGLRSPAKDLAASVAAMLASFPPDHRSGDLSLLMLSGNLISLQSALASEHGPGKCPCCKDSPERVERCDACGATGVVLRRCKRCLTAVYCSVECQKEAWRGGHREVCAEVRTAEAVADAGPGAAA